MTIPLKHRPDGLGEFEPNDVVPIEHGGTGETSLVATQDTLGILGKLDRSEYIQHFKGVFTSYVALTEALPTATDGDYAHIDSGSGFDRMVAIWDSSDSKWVISQANTGANTDEVPEGSQNLYFKEQRVLNTVLTGLGIGTPTDILATDNLIVALQKIQAQIKANSSANKPVNWIDVKTIAIFNVKVHLPGTTLKIANINGELWMKGSFQIVNQITTNDPIFTIGNKDWFVTTAVGPAYVGLTSTFALYSTTMSIYSFGFVQAPAINAMRFYCTQNTPSSESYNFIPFHVGTLINPAVGLI